MGEGGLSEIRFEFAKKQHLDEIKAISKQTYREHSIRNPDAFAKEYTTLPLEPMLVKSFNKNGESDSIIVALDGEIVVGHIIFIIYDHPSETKQNIEKIASIGDISIHPDYRGQGLGKKALQFLIPILNSRGVTRVDAQIWAGNTRSESLFKSASFIDAYREVRLRLNDPQPLPKKSFRMWAKWRTLVFWLILILAYALFRSQK